MTARDSTPPIPNSDRPAPDLNKERDAFIQTFLKKGVQLTEELLRENERLRKRNAELEDENAMLCAQVKSDNAIRELISKIEELETEKKRLMSQFHEVEAQQGQYAATFAEVEAELANLASLYVASNQLHSTLSLRGVIRQLKEMLAQLVGARSYAIYFVSDDGSRLLPIAFEGVKAEELAPVKVGEGPIGHAFSSGSAEVAEDADVSHRSVTEPAASVPLRIEDRLIGVVAIFSTLPQKTRFLPVDYEFFKLLAAHAASAIVAARLFAEGGGKTPGIDSFLDLGV